MGNRIGVVSRKIFDENIINTLFAVPLRQAVEVIAHGMEAAIICHLGKAYLVVAAGKRNIAHINHGFELRRIRITPELVILWSVPGQRSCHLNAVCHLIECKIGAVGVVVQN